MRIAVVAHSATRAGGVETYLAGIIPALAARGHAVACWFETTVEGAEAIVTPDHTGPVWIAAPQARDELQVLRKWRPDVIYLHGLRSVALERQLTGIAPVAFFAHSYYGSCISGEKSTRVPVLSPCDRAFGPACLVHYFPRRCGGLSPVTMLRQYGVQTSKQSLLHEYAVVLVASRHMAREYMAQNVHTRVVSLPVSATGVQARNEGRNSWNLLYLGRLERSKGVDVALQSVARAADALDRSVRLVIAGEGSLANGLQREAAALARSPRLSFDFAGWLSDGARASALADADLLLVPSLWPEPFGLVGLEAASAGVPAIAFRVGGVEDWLEDGITGRTVPLRAGRDDRIESFAGAIIQTLTDPDRLDAMRREAIAKARTFTMTDHVDSVEPILRELAERVRPRPRPV